MKLWNKIKDAPLALYVYAVTALTMTAQRAAAQATGGGGTADVLKQNDDLLALIWDVVRHENLGPRALESLMADTNFLVRKRTPALLLRWAYHEGGVPKSYREQFSHALVRSGIAAALLGYDGSDPVAIEVFDIKVSTFFAE